MTYVERILREQARLAAALRQEADGAPPEERTIPQSPVRGDVRQTPAETPEACGGQEEALPGPETGKAEPESGARVLLQRLREQENAQLRAARLARFAEAEGAAAFGQETAAAAWPGRNQAAGEPMSGADTARLRTQTEAARDVWQQTDAMGEISRFFERDARRYGG